ncbi:hypothetical protein WHR41_07441 [Cladosporium halotolerans]|uniref:Uncharacterized protein n=1 Tax=Cladosporium halotolerans TaxID=1052096 RepID=A0AB34KJN1_9PEZI
MPSIKSAFFALAAAAVTVQAEHLRVVWSAGSFSTIPGPSGGSESGHYSGFAIIRDDGEAIYDEGYPYGYSPCFNTGGGREFAIEGDCWDSQFRFHCEADFGGSPESCAVKDASGNVLGEGTGQSDIDFIGIAIGIDASCVVEFESDGGGCPVDNGNGPLHATGKSV